jgi:GNAT superfamily N-acetyltransferase
MFTELGTTVLKSGEEVEVGVVTGPDAAWHDRLDGFLAHKGGIWSHEVRFVLSEPCGLDARFYVLHRGGVPFSHIMTTTLQGVGILGHVYTNPDDRGQGAATLLMQKQLEHFQSQGERSLYLGTTYDSPAFHIYRKQGFVGLEDASGHMTFTPSTLTAFEGEYFALDNATVIPLDWPHWPASAPLFLSAEGGYTRHVGLKMLGQSLVEGPLLPLVNEQHEKSLEGLPPTAFVVQKPNNGAVVGLASWQDDTFWPDTKVVDLFCHTNYWHLAGELLEPMNELKGQRLAAYAEVGFAEKEKALLDFGFKPVITLPDWLKNVDEKAETHDVVMYKYIP